MPLAYRGDTYICISSLSLIYLYERESLEKLNLFKKGK